YAKVDFIYDTKPIGTFDYFVTSAIPTSGPDTQRGSQFTVQAKQTRLNLDLRRTTDWGPARLYVEADWFGDASYAFSSGGYKFRLRHAFGQVQNFAAGYSFSGFMDNDALPDTLDFEGPGSAPYLTLASARYTWKVGANTSIGLGAEAPSAEVTAPVGGGRSTFPDITLRGRYEADKGHLQLSGVWRRLGWRSGEGPSDTTYGYGINLAGSVKTVGDDYIVAGGVWGKGIARYVSDITGLGLDAEVDPDGNLVALEEYGGYAGYTHYWTPKLRSTAVVNYLGMNNKSWQAATAFSNSQYYSANLIWNPAGSLNVGLEVLYGRYKTNDGLSANDTRIQASVQYDFVR
ncbi:MAG: DcaP family trimeric outer membrane transporter, partial [Steroidobacteraceae bacterium]